MSQVDPKDQQAGPPPDYSETTGQPAGQPAYPPQGPPPMGVQPPPPGTTVIITAAPAIQVGEVPVTCQCPGCGATVTTATHSQNGLLTWAAMGGLCIFGCFLGCCLIPLCVDAAKDVEHTCPNCNRIVGKYERLKL